MGQTFSALFKTTMSQGPNMSLEGFLSGTPEPEIVAYENGTRLRENVCCPKNPTHSGFIPAKEFNKNHFPPGYRDEWRVEIVKGMCEMTVHLKRNWVSPHRPPGFHDYKHRGANKYRVGSGYVNNVVVCGDGGSEDVDLKCSCRECEDSPNPRKTWLKATIVTALHNVFDDAEAKDTTVTMFYDNEDDDSRRYVAYGHKVVHENVESDRCWFTVLFHDIEPAVRLSRGLQQYNNGRNGQVDRPGDPLVIVSHPHGLAKEVSIGNVVREEEYYEGNEKCRRYVYTTCTCPGSSGGMVAWGLKDGFTWETFPHSEALKDGNNRSGGGWSR